MNVGRVIVLVGDAVVAVAMGVLAGNRRIVHVEMVTVIVPVQVVVVDRRVDVAVRVSFGDMQPDPEPEQSRSHQRPLACRPVAVPSGTDAS